MGFRATSLRMLGASIFAAALTAVPVGGGALAADSQCAGHQTFAKPRQEKSCPNVNAQFFVSPDQKTHAVIYPSDVALYGSPDMESRVVFRSNSGDTLTSQDYSSPRGINGYYVASAQWSPDSRFFVFSLISSGGHSPWSYPMKVYNLKKNLVANFSDMINGNPTMSKDFRFSGPHTVIVSTWRQRGSIDDPVPVTVDLEAAFEKLPATPN
jgi:hypothetical protein